MGFLSLPMWMTSLGGAAVFGGILLAVTVKGVHKTSADWFRGLGSDNDHGVDHDNGPDL
jgi:hypothetical protein